MIRITTNTVPVHTIAGDGKTINLSDDDMLALYRDVRDSPHLRGLAVRAGLVLVPLQDAPKPTPKHLSLKQLTDLVASATAEEVPEDGVRRTFLYLSLGLKIHAIKSVRERYGLGLREAKDVVERLMDFNFNDNERLEDLLDGSVRRYTNEDGR